MNSVQITLRNVAHSPAVQQHIHDYLAKLQHHIDNIMSCRVIVAAPPKRPSKGKEYSVKLTLCLPNKELIVSQNKHDDLYNALHDAFQTILKRAENYLDWRQAKYNHVDNISHGLIIRLVPEETTALGDNSGSNKHQQRTLVVRCLSKFKQPR